MRGTSKLTEEEGNKMRVEYESPQKWWRGGNSITGAWEKPKETIEVRKKPVVTALLEESGGRSAAEK